jgi:hypothetical protein
MKEERSGKQLNCRFLAQELVAFQRLDLFARSWRYLLRLAAATLPGNSTESSAVRRPPWLDFLFTIHPKSFIVA